MQKYLLQTCCHYFFRIATVKLLQFYVHFRSFSSTLFTRMPSFNRYEKVTSGNCGTQITKARITRHKESCSAGTMYCNQCPYFLTKSQNDLNYHIVKEHSAPKPDVAFTKKLCYQEFPEFYALCQQKNTQNGMQIGSGTRDVDLEHMVGDVEEHSLR